MSLLLEGRIELLAHPVRVSENPLWSTMSFDMMIASQERIVNDGEHRMPPGWYESDSGRAYWDGKQWFKPSEEPGEASFGAAQRNRQGATASWSASSNKPEELEPLSGEEIAGGVFILGVAAFIAFSFFGLFGLSIFGWTVGDLFSDRREIACLEGGGSWSKYSDTCIHSNRIMGGSSSESLPDSRPSTGRTTVDRPSTGRTTVDRPSTGRTTVGRVPG